METATEYQSVFRWVVYQLLELKVDGLPAFDMIEAELLADNGVDYREVAALLSAGCLPNTALRILL
jgi:hypothetical protein